MLKQCLIYPRYALLPTIKFSHTGFPKFPSGILGNKEKLSGRNSLRYSK